MPKKARARSAWQRTGCAPAAWRLLVAWAGQRRGMPEPLWKARARPVRRTTAALTAPDRGRRAQEVVRAAATPPRPRWRWPGWRARTRAESAIATRPERQLVPSRQAPRTPTGSGIVPRLAAAVPRVASAERASSWAAIPPPSAIAAHLGAAWAILGRSCLGPAGAEPAEHSPTCIARTGRGCACPFRGRPSGPCRTARQTVWTKRCQVP